MYSIYTYMTGWFFMVNVGKYTIPMDPMGWWYCWWLKSGVHQLRLVVYPISYRVFHYIPWWLFCLGFLKHQGCIVMKSSWNSDNMIILYIWWYSSTMILNRGDPDDVIDVNVYNDMVMVILCWCMKRDKPLMTTSSNQLLDVQICKTTRVCFLI